MRPVLLLLVLFNVPSLQAQWINDVGLKAGQSYSYLTHRWPVSVTRSDQKVGQFGMLSINSFQNERFSLYTDLGFIQKGRSDRILDGSVHEATWDYFSFSPMLRYRVLPGSIRPYVFAGPSVDYLTGWRSNHGATNSGLQLEAVFGVNYGVGVEWVVKERIGIQLEAQDRPDITLYGQSAGGWKLTSRSFVLAAGIRYLLRRKDEPQSLPGEEVVDP